MWYIDFNGKWRNNKILCTRTGRTIFWQPNHLRRKVGFLRFGLQSYSFFVMGFVLVLDWSPLAPSWLGLVSYPFLPLNFYLVCVKKIKINKYAASVNPSSHVCFVGALNTSHICSNWSTLLVLKKS